VSSNAVTAPQRRFRSEHAQNSFDPLETVTRVFDRALRQFAEAALQIAETISPQHQLTHRTARLQSRERVRETAAVVVDLVAETAAQCFARADGEHSKCRG